MDQVNDTFVAFLLPKFILMTDKEINNVLPLRSAVYFAIFPLFVLLFVCELLRRTVKQKLSTADHSVISRPNDFIHIEGRCDKNYEEVKRAF